MVEEKKHESPNLTWMGCLLVVLLLFGSLFLSGVVLSRSGIGIIGNVNETSGSHAGVWKGKVNGNVMRINSDGTGTLRRNGRDEYFEWRLEGNDFGIFQFSKAKSVSASINRMIRGLGLHGERAHSNFKLVEVTSDKLTLALDDEPHPKSGYKRGDHIEYEAVSEETEVIVTAD